LTTTTVHRSVSIDKELVRWVEFQLKTKRFANFSHAVDFAIYQMMQKEDPTFPERDLKKERRRLGDQEQGEAVAETPPRP